MMVNFNVKYVTGFCVILSSSWALNGQAQKACRCPCCSGIRDVHVFCCLILLAP
ncbi:hypothetical protein PR003_g28779 [Phytophthora rubi]|uniref:RxLR effector protein n=2 Tax=Phytophthora TaxID=4783 RepID=A0A6A3HI85_9STRA|nr:hypothetical protein PR001_g28241 [Phytophthora rubi]KAE8968672.1 hypothetical protein PR002_g27677 [Phytophthora rubi]KAE9184417.1 hypothetical protein PF004_g23668 [Phytophthora fragariae]KAE9277478.1 hypothetical protein PR003_g28779 [Phytophthora rubi]